MLGLVVGFFDPSETCRAGRRGGGTPGRGGTLSGRELLKGGIEEKSTSLRNKESYSALPLQLVANSSDEAGGGTPLTPRSPRIPQIFFTFKA
jgi:hypothetical protein